jgi:hypothetical protein
MRHQKRGELTPGLWRERLRWMINQPNCPADIKKECRQMLAEAQRRKRQEAPQVVIRITLD